MVGGAEISRFCHYVLEWCEVSAYAAAAAAAVERRARLLVHTMRSARDLPRPPHPHPPALGTNMPRSSRVVVVVVGGGEASSTI